MVKEEDYLLTNQEILGGIKAALERGQNLKQAMMAFYQAGYKKEEIEDAARAYLYLQRGNSEAEVLNKMKTNSSGATGEKETEVKGGGTLVNKKPEEKQEVNGQPHGLFHKTAEENNTLTQPTQKMPAPLGGAILNQKSKEEEKKVVQKISGYEDQSKKETGKFKSKAITSVLVITLIVLVMILALVFLFKAELVNFINSLFG